MQDRIPEQTATVAQLADEAAHAARLVPCGVCWQQPGKPCTKFYPRGDHLGRYMRAERRGLLSRAELTRVVAGLDVVAAHVIIPDVTP